MTDRTDKPKGPPMFVGEFVDAAPVEVAGRGPAIYLGAVNGTPILPMEDAIKFHAWLAEWIKANRGVAH